MIMKGSGTYQKLVNKHVKGNKLKTWTDEFGKKQTEKHMVLINNKGKPQIANYMGPNTDYYTREYK